MNFAKLDNSKSFMNRAVAVITLALGMTLALVSFNAGRVVERRVLGRSAPSGGKSVTPIVVKQHRLSSDEADQTNRVIIANVACVSFAELWDVMRAASPEARNAWAHTLSQLPAGTRRNAAMKSFYKIWAELDPKAAVQALERIQDKQLQSLAFYSAAQAAADSALSAFAKLEDRLGYRRKSFSATSIVARWAVVDPEAVAHFLEQHPQTEAEFFMDVAARWVNSDPKQAADWFTNLRLPPWHDPKFPRAEDRRRFEAARGLLLGWLEIDARRAAAFVTTHVDDPEINKSLAEFGLALFTESPHEATAFILSLPTENAQRAALEDLVARVGKERVIILREGGDDEEPEEPEMTSEEIRPWLIALPAKMWIDHAGDIFANWDASHPSQAENWLRTLPPDEQQKVVVDYSATASVEQAARVVELSPIVRDASIRRDALRKFVDNLSDNPSEARAKIATLLLTKQQKEMLLRLIRDQ